MDTLRPNFHYNMGDPGTWIVLLIILLSILLPITCKAQSDTIMCKTECIKNYVSKTSEKGNVKIYAVYTDEKNNILDLIPVSKSVYEYIQLCESNGIKPSLGIRIKNNQIYSIVRYKKRYETKNK